MYCPKCGQQIADESCYCRFCGENVSAFQPRKLDVDGDRLAELYVGTKNGSTAVILSLLITGLGQMYAGKFLWGALLIILQVALAFMILFLLIGNSTLIAVPIAASIGVWLYNMYDANMLVKEYNEGLLSRS